MKKVFFVVVMLLLGGLPLFAAVQNIRLRGDVAVHGIARWNYEEETPAAHIRGEVRREGANWFQSIARLQADVDMTDNVEAVIRILNERDWDAETPAATDIDLDLAYVTLREMFFSPVTLRIGRQNIVLGEGFVLGQNNADTSLFLIPNPHGIQEGFGMNMVTATARDYAARKAFDGITLTYSYEPYTIDLIFAMLEERHTPPNYKDAALYGINIGYELDNAELEGYLLNVRDRRFRPDASANVSVAGVRGSFEPAEAWLLKGEFAYQFGKVDVVAERDIDIKAFATNVAVEHTFNIEYAPKIGAAFAWFSGDDNIDIDNRKVRAWIPYFEDQTWGAIVDYIYGNSNLVVLRVDGSIEPTPQTTLGADWYHFWAHRTPRGVSDRIGHELNLYAQYEYTENVSFKLLAAAFFPNDYVRDIYAHDLGVPRDRVALEDAYQLVGSMILTF